MKKTILVFLITCLILQGCKNIDKSHTVWSEADFSFYDEQGKEVYYPTVEDYWVDLTSANEETGEKCNTKRGVVIGDKATSLMGVYDLSDFEYSIADYTYINPSTDEADKADIYFHEKAKTVTDILKIIDQVAAKELDLYISCDIYKLGGKLCTYSALSKDELSNEDFVMEHKKYSISFQTDGEKIHDVNIESHYHNYLSAFGKNLDDPEFSWLIDMGN